MPYIKLKSSEGEIFTVDSAVIQQSGTIKTMLEGLGTKCDELVPLPNVDSAMLEKVIAWCTKHHGIDKEYYENEDNEVTWIILSWEEEFFKVDDRTLVEMMHVANYLHIDRLMELSCKAFAKELESMSSAEDIRRRFNIRNDFHDSEDDDEEEYFNGGHEN